MNTNISKELKTIRDMIRTNKKNLNDYTDMRDNKNESEIADAQNALIEVDDAKYLTETETENAICELSEELDERIADLENALCEFTEE